MKASSWTDTHFEISRLITIEEIGQCRGEVGKAIEIDGVRGLRSLAVQLANEFEDQHKDTDWGEVDYWEEIDSWWERRVR